LITFSTTSNGSTLTGAPAAQASTIADQLTQGSSKLTLVARPYDFDEKEMIAQRPSVNTAAMATPPFLNVGTQAFSLNPGDTGAFILDVHQSLVYRGENVFFAWFNSNDEDYFLDSALATRVDPQVRGMIIGGCLLDTATLHFGTGGANIEWTLNVPRYGKWGDEAASANAKYIQIDGNNADFYGGFVTYGVSQRRIAMNTQDWWTGDGEARAYKAIQADPNLCTVNCKPALLASQTFGMITETGAAYVPLTGNLICTTFLDSVQMWAPIDTTSPTGYGAWNWNNTWLTAGTYNNDSTMGLITQCRTIGFMNPPAAYPDLGRCAVDFWKTYLRYPGAPGLTNWRVGEFEDYDMGGDTALYFGAASVVVGTGTRTTGTWGTIKLPFGGGCNSTVYPSILNAMALNSNQSMNSNTAPTGNVYFDSTWMYGAMSGARSQGPMAGADNRWHSSWLTHDFPNSDDTLTFAVAHFGNPTLASPRNGSSMAIPLANLLNKWVGMNRGDVNNDGSINIADIVYLADYVYAPTTDPLCDTAGVANAAHRGPIPVRSCWRCQC